MHIPGYSKTVSPLSTGRLVMIVYFSHVPFLILTGRSKFRDRPSTGKQSQHLAKSKTSAFTSISYMHYFKHSLACSN